MNPLAELRYFFTALGYFTRVPVPRWVGFEPAWLNAAARSVGQWILYQEPKRAGRRGYYAAARVEQIVRDPSDAGMFLALIEPGTYLDFIRAVPFSGPEGPIERGVLNDAGAISGRRRPPFGRFRRRTSRGSSARACRRTTSCCLGSTMPKRSTGCTICRRRSTSSGRSSSG